MRTNVAGRYVHWVGRRHRLVLAVGALLTLVGALAASRLSLRPGLRELLPRGDRAAFALGEAERRVGESQSLVVAVSTTEPDPARAASATHAAADALGAAVLSIGPPLVDRVVWRVGDLRAFFERHRFLYADEALLADVLARVRFEKETRKNPLFVALDEPPTFEALAARAETKRPALGALPADYLETEGGRVVALLVLPGRGYRAGASDRELEDAVRGAIARARLPASVTVSLAGEVHTAVEERRAIEEDVALTSALVVALVCLLTGLYFGRLRAIPLMAAPALTGAALSLGFAGLAFGTLNASTAFLGGIIVGNGINYPILVLARYDEERARGQTVEEALALALAGTARPTALAAFAAAFAYGSLALTRFRGFSQFGAIGAVGMALCWAASMTLLPALLFALDEGRAPVRRVRRVNFGALLARVAERRSAALIAVAAGAALTVCALLALPAWARDPYEYDFRNLRSATVDDRTSSRLDPLFGRSLTPSLVLADSRADARLARRAILDAGAARSPDPIAHAVVLDDFLPGPRDVQERRIALAEAIRAELPEDQLALLSPQRRAQVERLLPPAGLTPIDERDLPDLVTQPFRELDGSVGRLVLVYPPQAGFSSWNGHDLFRLADVIGDVPLASGHHAVGAGRAVTWASIIAAIAHDGALATLVSLAGVSLLSLALLGGSGAALWVIGALCVGVLWLLGATALLGEKLNFLNFVALPITFGIGVDYAANVVMRYRGEGRGSIARVLRSTGGAVLLNSLTTVEGYAALLVAHNRALRSFGLLAILGELACAACALVVLPAVLALRDGRRRAPAAIAALT